MASLIMTRKLQTIFSLVLKVSFDHFRLFTKVVRLFWRVWKIFLSVWELTWLALMVILALSSWESKRLLNSITGNIRITTNLRMHHVYYPINDIFCDLLFWFSFKIKLLAALFKDGDLIGIVAKTGTGII